MKLEMQWKKTISISLTLVAILLLLHSVHFYILNKEVVKLSERNANLTKKYMKLEKELRKGEIKNENQTNEEKGSKSQYTY